MESNPYLFYYDGLVALPPSAGASSQVGNFRYGAGGPSNQSAAIGVSVVNISPSTSESLSQEAPSRSQNYFVRIIPMDKKSDAKTYEWHGVHDKFLSPTELKTKLMDTFKDKLPPTFDFQVGYITKKGNSKRWIEREEDLSSMYRHCSGSDSITIFCDGKPKEFVRSTQKRKRTTEVAVAGLDHEEEVKEVASDLEIKHGDKWNERQYQIWARMYVNKQWESLAEPPNIPLITGGVTNKHPRKESLSDAISGAAIAFAKVLTEQKSNAQASTRSTAATSASTFPGVSPSSKARLSNQYISQLKALQDLREIGGIGEEEFQELKKYTIESLRGMNKPSNL